MSCKISFRVRFYLLLKTENSRRVVKSDCYNNWLRLLQACVVIVLTITLATLSTDDEDENEDKIMTQMLQRDWSESVTNFVFGAKNRI